MITDARLILSDITICAIDCIAPNLALKAINKSIQVCSFGDALLLTSEQMDCMSSIKKIAIKKLNSIDAYSQFVMKDLHQYIETPYVLLVQWDGYVIDPLAWNSSFMLYDYIGAKWHWHQDGKTVGNGGFSLRSKRLLDAVASADFPFLADVPEDEQICRIYRNNLESNFGINFAPEDVADQFSYERSLPDSPTFGFHGLFNLWRHLDDAEVKDMARQFPASIFSSVGFYEFFLQYFLLRRFKPLGFLYSELVKHAKKDQIHANVLNVTKDQNFTGHFIHLCDEIISRHN